MWCLKSSSHFSPLSRRYQLCSKKNLPFKEFEKNIFLIISISKRSNDFWLVYYIDYFMCASALLVDFLNEISSKDEKDISDAGKVVIREHL